MSKSVVPVHYWDFSKYNPDGEQTSGKFMMEIDDQRESNGQAYVTTAAQNGKLEDMLSITLEINRLPESEDDVPCCHVHFDDSNLAFSLFKVGDKIILRPETDVRIMTTNLRNGEAAYVIE